MKTKQKYVFDFVQEAQNCPCCVTEQQIYHDIEHFLSHPIESICSYDEGKVFADV